MIKCERAFVFNAIQKHKPKKIVEIGIAAGANSVLILDFLFSNNFLDSTSLYALDYNMTYKELNSSTSQKKCGVIMLPTRADF